MARVCHLNSCPVGVTTQRPELREKFPGVPEDVVNYFAFVAEEVRWYLAALGCKVRKKRERGKREMGVGWQRAGRHIRPFPRRPVRGRQPKGGQSSLPLQGLLTSACARLPADGLN